MPHVHFTFPEPLKEELERHVPLRERSLFVSRATEQALQMRRLQKTLSSKRHVGTYPEVAVDLLIRRIRKRGRKIHPLS